MKVYVNTTFTVDHGLYGVVPDMYDLNRLRFRIRTLRDVCLPSINSQTYENVEHRIFYSDLIPKEIEDVLLSLPMPRSKLVKLQKGRHPYFQAAKTVDSRCIHVNLDDDDSLAPWYIKLMVDSCKNEAGEVLLTFLDGAVVNWKDEHTENPLKEFSCGSRMFYPMNNHGMALLTSNGHGTHEFGNHTKIVQSYPHLKVIEVTNNGKIGWVRTESRNSHHKTYHPKTLLKRPFLSAKTVEEVYNL